MGALHKCYPAMATSGLRQDLNGLNHAYTGVHHLDCAAIANTCKEVCALLETEPQLHDHFDIAGTDDTLSTYELSSLVCDSSSEHSRPLFGSQPQANSLPWH